MLTETFPLTTRTTRHGSGALLGPSHADAWEQVLKLLPLGEHDRVVRTGDLEGLSALVHLLWWAPSVRAVIVDQTAHEDEDEDGSTEAIRRAIELSGSDALLLVDAPASEGMGRLQRQARWADLVLATDEGRGDDLVPATLLAWSPRLAPELELLDGLHPLSYDVVARFQ